MEENKFQNVVCEMLSISFWPQWVNKQQKLAKCPALDMFHLWLFAQMT